MPNANHDTDKLTLFAGKERIIACIVAFFLTFVIHFWLQSLFAAPVQAVSDKIFPGSKIQVSMNESILYALIVIGAVGIPSVVSAAVVFGLSSVRGLTLPRAVSIWLAVITAVSFVWGIVAGRYQLT